MEEQIIEQSGVEEVSAAEGQAESAEVVSDQAAQSSPDTTEAQQNNFEKAFAKRLTAEREKWQQEVSDKYKHYDHYERAAKYLQKQNNIEDVLTLAQQIELAELQEQAEKQNVPVEVLQRIQTLEAEAAEGRQLKQQQQNLEFYRGFQQQLNEFVQGKDVGAKELEDYMLKEEVKSMDVAYRALRAEKLEQELSSIRQKTEAETIKKIQQNAVTSPGSVSQGAENQSINFATLSKEKQREVIERVKRGELRSLNDI